MAVTNSLSKHRSVMLSFLGCIVKSRDKSKQRSWAEERAKPSGLVLVELPRSSVLD